METAVKNQETKPVQAKGKIVPIEEQYYQLPVSMIEISASNYRKFYDQQALEEFAEQLKSGEVGMQHPITVRPKGRKYELVFGERRFRAALLAGLTSVPARIKDMTDVEMRKTRLAENIQRENPHPLHEALDVKELMEVENKTLVQAAQMLGKSTAYVHNRLKLAELIEPLQELLIAGKLTVNEATELGTLAKDSQEQFLTQHCTDWKKQKHFSIGNVRYLISRYKYDLKKAPFNTKDKKLVPDVGACTDCPFNSATLKTLFPEMAKEAVCSNKTCFKNKCLAGAEASIRAALETYQPAAILLAHWINEEYTSLMDSLPETVALPRYDLYSIKRFEEPTKPERNLYQTSNNKGKSVLDRERFSHAIREYREDLAEYKRMIASEGTLLGIAVSGAEIHPVYFNPSMKNVPELPSSGEVTAKEVQQAIKDGTVTPELLEKEVERIKSREQRSKELDRKKVQERLHEEFTGALEQASLKRGNTAADKVAMRFIVYEALNYQYKNKIEKQLFPKGYKDSKDFLEKLAAITDAQFAQLIRAVICGNCSSKIAETSHGYCLYNMAAAAGVDVAALEADQAGKAAERQKRLKERTKGLQAQIKKLNAEKAA